MDYRYKTLESQGDIYKFSSNLDSLVDFSVIKNNSLIEQYQFKCRIINKIVDSEKLLFDVSKYISNKSESKINLLYDVSRLDNINLLKLEKTIKSFDEIEKEVRLGNLIFDTRDVFLNFNLLNDLSMIEYCNQMLLLTSSV